MPNVNIWIRDPYPFWLKEQIAIQEALKLTYGNQSLIYFDGFPSHHVSIDSVNITTCKQIVSTLKTIHRMHARMAQNLDKTYCRQLEIVILGQGDGRPEWAKEQHGENETGNRRT